jgi:hypothetical protein
MEGLSNGKETLHVFCLSPLPSELEIKVSNRQTGVGKGDGNTSCCYPPSSQEATKRKCARECTRLLNVGQKGLQSCKLIYKFNSWICKVEEEVVPSSPPPSRLLYYYFL